MPMRGALTSYCCKSSVHTSEAEQVVGSCRRRLTSVPLLELCLADACLVLRGRTFPVRPGHCHALHARRMCPLFPGCTVLSSRVPALQQAGRDSPLGAVLGAAQAACCPVFVLFPTHSSANLAAVCAELAACSSAAAGEQQSGPAPALAYVLIAIDGTWRQAKELFKVRRTVMAVHCRSCHAHNCLCCLSTSSLLFP